MQGGVVPLLGPDGGMGKAFSNSANYGSRLSTIYSPTPAGNPEIERHSKLHIIKKKIHLYTRPNVLYLCTWPNAHYKSAA